MTTVARPELSTPADVLALDDTAFEALIIDQIHPPTRSQHLWDLLLGPQLLPRTHETLDVLKMRTERVLDNKSAELDVFRAQCDRMGPSGARVWQDGRPERMASFQKSRQFLALVDIALVHVDHRERQTGTTRQAESGRILRTLPALRQLTTQILAHQDEMKDDPSQADEELWELLDTITVVMGERRLSLRQAHERGWDPGPR